MLSTCTWDFPDVIKFRALQCISEKVIRFRHQDYDPDRAQKLISSSISRHLSTRNISSKSIHAFLSNLANRQTETNAGSRIYLLRCRRSTSDVDTVDTGRVLVYCVNRKLSCFILFFLFITRGRSETNSFSIFAKLCIPKCSCCFRDSRVSHVVVGDESATIVQCLAAACDHRSIRFAGNYGAG